RNSTFGAKSLPPTVLTLTPGIYCCSESVMFSELVRAIWLASTVVMVPGTLSASKAFSGGTCDGPGSGVGALTVTCCGVGCCAADRFLLLSPPLFLSARCASLGAGGASILMAGRLLSLGTLSAAS